MRVLMLGWEFPPAISGGLGTACEGLAKAMGRCGVDVLFVLPQAGGPAESPGAAPGAPEQTEYRGLRRRSSLRLRVGHTPTMVLNPYSTLPYPAPTEALAPALVAARAAPGNQDQRHLRIVGAGTEGGYAGDILTKIHDYARHCVELTRGEIFEVIHAHDWLTFPASTAIAERSGKPLVVHIHATELDRSGSQLHPPIYQIERAAMVAAARVIAVSEYTRRILVEKYAVPPEKVTVIHNGIEMNGDTGFTRSHSGRKTVLFLGRITRQKGPEYFLAAASRVLERAPETRFVMAGRGDLAAALAARTAAMGLTDYISFPGFLRGSEVDRAFRAADVYVMPSVSEPFGLSALEAARNGTPVIVSKTSGAAEVLRQGSLQVDYWDVDRLAECILTVLQRPEVAERLRRHAVAEAARLSWGQTAGLCLEVYRQVTARR